MTPRPNTLIAVPGENIFKVYDQVRSYILDKEARADFDHEMDSLEGSNDLDEAEEYFGDMILDYINEFVTPPGTLFGINADSGEIGFWEEELIGEEFDDNEYEENPDDEEELSEESREEILEQLLKQDDVRRSQSREEGVEDSEKSGQAEVLDDEGKVVTTTTFKTSPEPAKSICMICKKHLRGDPDAPDELTSHGLCEDCLEKHYPEEEEDDSSS